MSDYLGIPLKGQPNSGIIFAPENAPHRYDANGDLKVLYVVADSLGTLPADPPEANKDEGYRRGSPRALPWLEPHASYRDDGTVATDGYLPDGSFVKAEPAKVLSEAEKAAKAFKDALADPSSLVPAALKQKPEDKFITAVINAVKEYIA